MDHKTVTMLHAMNWIEVAVQVMPVMKDQTVKSVAIFLNLGLRDHFLTTDLRFKGNGKGIHSQRWLGDGGRITNPDTRPAYKP